MMMRAFTNVYKPDIQSLAHFRVRRCGMGGISRGERLGEVSLWLLELYLL